MQGIPTITIQAMDIINKANYQRKERMRMIKEVFELYKDMPPVDYKDKDFFNREFDKLYDAPFRALEDYYEALIVKVYPDQLTGIY